MPAINAAQLRAARGLLRLSATRLARLSGVEEAMIRDFEEEAYTPPAEARKALRSALEAGGAMFLPDTTRGVGVRFKFNSREVRAIVNWEDEGGTVGEDDVP